MFCFLMSPLMIHVDLVRSVIQTFVLQTTLILFELPVCQHWNIWAAVAERVSQFLVRKAPRLFTYFLAASLHLTLFVTHAKWNSWKPLSTLSIWLYKQLSRWRRVDFEETGQSCTHCLKVIAMEIGIQNWGNKNVVLSGKNIIQFKFL